MPYLNRFDYDIFLSHSWSNIIDENKGDRQWVNDLKIKLEMELTARLARQVSILLDTETPRNGDTDTLFREYVRRSAIFLAIVTPGFCSEKSYCRKELNWFCRESRPISARPLLINKRLFKVVSRPVADAVQPEEIRTSSPYTFYEGNPTQNLLDYQLLPVSAISADPLSRISREYTGRLVPALAMFLDRCKQDQSNFPVRTVFLAETTCAEKEQVLRELAGHEIVSCTPNDRMIEPDFIAQTDEALSSSDCSIHLIDTSLPLMSPLGWARSVVENQLFCSQNIRKLDFRAFVWCYGERSIEDLSLRTLMERTRDEYANTGPMKYIPQGIQYFTSNLIAMLTQESRRELPLPARPLGRRLFVQCTERDLNRLEPAFDKLIELGISVQLPAFRGRQADKDRLFKRFLDTTDGTLIYWGSGADASTYMLCDRSIDAYGEDLLHKQRVIGIDPPTDVKRRFFSHPNFITIPFPADPERLTLKQLREAFLS